MMKGKFTLRDMYKQLEALNKMGPLKQIMGMLPMGNMQLPKVCMMSPARRWSGTGSSWTR